MQARQIALTKPEVRTRSPRVADPEEIVAGRGIWRSRGMDGARQRDKQQPEPGSQNGARHEARLARFPTSAMVEVGR